MPRKEVNFAPQLEQLGAFADAGNPTVTPNQRLTGVAGSVNVSSASASRAAGQEALNLANSLGALNRGLGPVQSALAQELDIETKARDKRSKEILAIKGRDFANSAAAVAGAKAVQAGVLPENAHPIYVQNFNEQAGRNQGFAYSSQLSKDYAEQRTDGLDMEEFLRSNREAALAGISDPTQRGEFNRIADGLDNNLRAQQNQFILTETRRKKREQSGIEYSNTIEGYIRMKTQAGGKIKMEEIAALGERIFTADRFSAMNPREIAQVKLDTAIRFAEKFNRVEFHELALADYHDIVDNQMKPGPGKTIEGQKALEASRNRIAAKIKRESAEFRAKSKFEKAAKLELGKSLLGRIMKADPTRVLSEVEDRWFRDAIPQFDEELARQRKLFTERHDIPVPLVDKANLTYIIKTNREFGHEELHQALSKEGYTDPNFGVIRIAANDYDRFSGMVSAQLKDRLTNSNPYIKEPYRNAENEYINSIKPERNFMGRLQGGEDKKKAAGFKTLQTSLRKEFFNEVDARLKGRSLGPVKEAAILSEVTELLKKRNQFLFHKEGRPQPGAESREQILNQEVMPGASAKQIRDAMTQWQTSRTGPLAAEFNLRFPDGVEPNDPHLMAWFNIVETSLQNRKKKKK
jgi:hypothetical protein